MQSRTTTLTALGIIALSWAELLVAACPDIKDDGAHWDTYCIYEEIVALAFPHPLQANIAEGLAFRYLNTYNKTPGLEFSASIQRSSKSSDPLLEVTYRKMAGERLHYQLYAIEKELGGVYPGRDQILEHLTFSEAETNSSSCRELRDLWGDLANMDIQKEWSLAPADQQRPNEILVWPHAPIWQIAYFSENSTTFIETSDSENQIAAWIERTIEMLSGCIEKSYNQSNKALASRAGRG